MTRRTFVSFPTLKDPAHATRNATPRRLWRFAPGKLFGRGPTARRRTVPKSTKRPRRGSAQFLAQFTRHFPRLAPLVDFHELSTPLSQTTFVDADQGATYGLEMSAERIATCAQRVRTPIRGLMLAGQDVTGPGIAGALMGGFMAAAATEPRLWREMNR